MASEPVRHWSGESFPGSRLVLWEFAFFFGPFCGCVFEMYLARDWSFDNFTRFWPMKRLNMWEFSELAIGHVSALPCSDRFAVGYIGGLPHSRWVIWESICYVKLIHTSRRLYSPNEFAYFEPFATNCLVCSPEVLACASTLNILWASVYSFYRTTSSVP